MNLQLTSFSCPACGQRFAWRHRYARRKFACACGHVMLIPAAAPLAAEDHEPPQPQPLRLVLDPITAELTAPAAQPPTVLDYSPASAGVGVRTDQHLSLHLMRDIWLPTAIIAAGLLLLLLVAITCAGSAGTRAAQAMLINLALRLAWDMGITFIAGVLIAGLLDCGLGHIAAAGLKLAAIAVSRFAVASLFNIPMEHLGGALLGLMASLPLLAGLISYFLDLDVRETIFAVVLLTLLRIISYFGMWKLL